MLTLLAQSTQTVTIPTVGLPVLEFGPVLTFLIRLIFIIAGITALFVGLLGGMDWITSNGEKEALDKARNKIQAAIVGIFVLVLILTIFWTIEQVVFKKAICFGISCEIKIPSLVGGSGSGAGGGQNNGIGDCESFCTKWAGDKSGYCPNTSACPAGIRRVPIPQDFDKSICGVGLCCCSS